MLFNSWVFWGFLLAVLALYHVLRRRGQNVLLLLASYVFYGAWDWRFLGLLAGTTLVDWLVGLGLAAGWTPRRRKALLVASIAANLGVLGFFKYFGFFTDSAARLASALGLAMSPVMLDIVLPVGISFYTFQSMSYSIDVYRGDVEVERSLVDFALYVAYFPQLVAGPIERASRLLPQLRQPRIVRDEHLLSGLFLILTGLVRKVAIADSLAPHVDAAFADPGRLGSVDLLVALYAFAIQIYCDFSGYSDIARGVSRLFGIELMVNFRRPYFATNITDFWRRWHVSLSTWLRDYLYIPLGGNRQGRLRTDVNLMTTMLLGGLWHGARWTFVAWGGLHGLFLAAHKTWRRRRPAPERPSRLRSLACGLATFHLVCLAWLFFRAESFGHAGRYLGELLSGREGLRVTPLHALLSAGLLALLVDVTEAWLERRRLPLSALRPVALGVHAGLLLLVLLVFGDRADVPFIYFQF